MTGFNVNCKDCEYHQRRINLTTGKIMHYCIKPRIIPDIEQNIDCAGYSPLSLIDD